MDSVRKAYQQAVVMPLSNVEQIWSEYNHWEQNLNKLTVSPAAPCFQLNYQEASSLAIVMLPSRLEMTVETRDLPKALARLFALTSAEEVLLCLYRDCV